MTAEISPLRMAVVFLVLLAGCSKSAPSSSESSDGPASNSGASEAAVRPSSPSGNESVSGTRLSASAIAQAGPLIERYLEATGIAQREDGDSLEEAEGQPSVHLLRSSEESEILKEIRRAEPDVRLAVLVAMVEAAERRPSVIGRLDDVTHAVVGLDPALRSRVIETIVRPRCQESTATNGHRAAVRVGIFLQVDDEIAGFAKTAVRVLLDTPETLRAEGSYASERRLTVYADRISSDDPLEDGRLLVAVLQDKRLTPTPRHRLVARLYERLSQADPREIASDDNTMLWVWFLGKGHLAQQTDDVNSAAARERRCVELFRTMLKEDPEVVLRDFLEHEYDSGRVVSDLRIYLPELYAVLPEWVIRRAAEKEKDMFRQAAQKEKDVFLAAMQPDPRNPDAEKRPDGPATTSATTKKSPKIPRLRLAAEYLTQDERREIVAAIVEKMKTCEWSQLPELVQRLSSLRSPLTGDECIAVLEALEPSPFDSKKKEPAIAPGSYRNVVASFPNEELDEVARWLFERIRGVDKPAVHYFEGFTEAAVGCKPETATTMMTYFCENARAGAFPRPWDAVAILAKLVPEAAATPLAEQMVAAAGQHPDVATSLAHMQLAGALANAAPRLRYQAFEYVLAETEYDPGISGQSDSSTDPKGSLLARCGSEMAAITAVLSPDDKQRAFEILMATLTGEHASREALVLVRGLVALAADLSADDAQRAFEVLVRLNAADTRQRREMPQHVRQFLAARDLEERPRLLKLLLPTVIDGQFRIRTTPIESSDVVSLMTFSAKELTSAEARETLDVMYDLLQAQEAGASEYLFRPFLGRIAAEERESFAQKILDRMQRSTVASHIVVFEDGVTLLRHGASAETGEAPAVRQPVPSVSQRPSTTVKRNVSFDDLADNDNRVRNLPSYLDAQGQLSIEQRLALVQRLDEKGYLTTSSGCSFEFFALEWIVRDVPADAPETVVKMLAEPDCVGFRQRLLTAVLAAPHEDRYGWSELWELADLFGAAP